MKNGQKKELPFSWNWQILERIFEKETHLDSFKRIMQQDSNRKKFRDRSKETCVLVGNRRFLILYRGAIGARGKWGHLGEKLRYIDRIMHYFKTLIQTATVIFLVPFAEVWCITKGPVNFLIDLSILFHIILGRFSAIIQQSPISGFYVITFFFCSKIFCRW